LFLVGKKLLLGDSVLKKNSFKCKMREKETILKTVSPSKSLSSMQNLGPFERKLISLSENSISEKLTTFIEQIDSVSGNFDSAIENFDDYYGCYQNQNWIHFCQKIVHNVDVVQCDYMWVFYYHLSD